MVMDSIGEFTGSMQYDPNEDYVETMRETEL
jgi:hypothetical protein